MSNDHKMTALSMLSNFYQKSISRADRFYLHKCPTHTFIHVHNASKRKQDSEKLSDKQ